MMSCLFLYWTVLKIILGSSGLMRNWFVFLKRFPILNVILLMFVLIFCPVMSTPRCLKTNFYCVTNCILQLFFMFSNVRWKWTWVSFSLTLNFCLRKWWNYSDPLNFSALVLPYLCCTAYLLVAGIWTLLLKSAAFLGVY